jgi:hypothetical protein
LSTAFPKLKAEVAISPRLKLNYQDAGVYQNLEQYASYLLNLSRSILGAKDYLGVHVSVDNNKLHVWDGTGPQINTDIRAIDLIGQPTWIGVNIVEIKVVMRSYVKLNDILIIPPGTLINFAGPDAIQGNVSKQRSNVTFEGFKVSVTKINHIGDFRNPDGNYWSTIIRGLALNPQVPTTVGLGMIPAINNNGVPLANATTPIITIPPNPKTPAPQIAPQFGSMFKRRTR